MYAIFFLLKFIWEWSFLTQKRKIAYMWGVLWWNTEHYKDERRRRNQKWVVVSKQWSVICSMNVWCSLGHKYIDYMEYVLCNIFSSMCVKSCIKWKKSLDLWNSKIRGLCCIYSFLDIYTVNYKMCGWEHSRKFGNFLVITAFIKTGPSLVLFIFYTLIILRKEF